MKMNCFDNGNLILRIRANRLCEAVYFYDFPESPPLQMRQHCSYVKQFNETIPFSLALCMKFELNYCILQVQYYSNLQLKKRNEKARKLLDWATFQARTVRVET